MESNKERRWKEVTLNIGENLEKDGEIIGSKMEYWNDEKIILDVYLLMKLGLK